MRQWRNWLDRLAGVLDWSAADKGILIMAMLIPLYLQYVGWSFYVLLREDRALLVDAVFLRGQWPVVISFVGIALFLLLLGVVLRRRRPNARIYMHLCANYYSLTLVYCGYVIGSLEFTSGVVMTGAPLVGLILFERSVIYTAWGIAVAAVVLVSYAGAAGLLQYAPALVPPTPGDSANQLFWVTSTLFFAAPHIISIVILGDRMMARWREREEAFRTLSMTDALTGVHNRRSVLDILERELARTRRGDLALTVLLLDLDHFKKINDHWGHPMGDRVLKEAAQALAGCLRDYDAVGRWGGEEFLLVLPDTRLDTAQMLAERCRQRLASLDIRGANGARVSVSGSFGLCCNSIAPNADATNLVRLADEALYRAKQGGRNRVELASTADL